MIAKKKHIRKWQRITMGLALFAALLLFLPFAQKNPLISFWHYHALFSIPDAPKFSYTKGSDKNLVSHFYWQVNSADPNLLTQLQQAGLPASIQDKTILVGPYLDEFKTDATLKTNHSLTKAKVNFLNKTE